MEKIYKNWFAGSNSNDEYCVYIYFKDGTMEITPVDDLSLDETVEEKCKTHHIFLRNKKINKILNGR